MRTKIMLELLFSIKGILLIVALIMTITLFLRELQYATLLKIHRDQIACRSKEQANELHFFQSNGTATSKKDVKPYRIAVGIFSIERPNAPDYVYAEVMSILDSMMVNQTYIQFDLIHVFDGSLKNGSQTRYFKYCRHIRTHPMDPVAYELVKDHAVHRKASLNYLLTLKYLVKRYDTHNVDAYLVLEDDVIFDPHASYLIWKALNKVRHQPLFLIDGYVMGPMHTIAEENEEDPLWEFKGDERCCSQAFLLSPQVAKISIPLIEMSLNNSVEYLPLDVYLTASLLKIPDFHFYIAKHCWVQHIGYPLLGLGNFHRGGSRMQFG